MPGKKQKEPNNGDGADGDGDHHSNSDSGHKEPLPPLYWSVFHHQNLHADRQRQDNKLASGSPDEERVKINNAEAIPETTPLIRERSSSSHKRWSRVKEAVKTNELFIRYTSGLDAGNHDAHITQRWSDLASASYELTLRECLFLFIALLAMGVLAYSFIFEHWGIIDSLYFTVVMLSTTGYGDMSPSTPGGKLFASVFALAGIVLLGLVLGVIGSQLIEAEITYSQKMKTEATKVLEKTFTTRSLRSHHQMDEGEGDTVMALDMHVVEKSFAPRNDSSLSMDSLQSQEPDSVGRLLEHREKHIFVSRVMKQLPGIIPLLIGGIIMAVLEHWKWYDVIYYCVATATVRVSIGNRRSFSIIASTIMFLVFLPSIYKTIGFGDLVPHREISKLVAVFFVPIGVAMMGQILGA